MTNSKAILIFFLIFLASCSAIPSKIGDMSKNSCSNPLNDSSFDAAVSRAGDNPLLDLIAEYEKSYNTKIISELSFLLSEISTLNINEAEYEDLRKKVADNLRSEIGKIDAIAKYIQSSDSVTYDSRVLHSLLSKRIKQDMFDAIGILTKYHKVIFSGNIPQDISFYGVDSRCFFCSTSSSGIRLGRVGMNAFFHALVNTILTVRKIGVNDIRMNGAPFVQSSVIFRQIQFPRKFLTSDAYLSAKNSKYIFAPDGGNRHYLAIASIGYDGVFRPSSSSISSKYNPWYSNVLKIDRNITPNFMFWSHNLYTKRGYVPGNFISKIALYESFVDHFKPVQAKDAKSAIKPGQLILIKDYISGCNTEECLINGYSDIVGLVIDYEQSTNSVLIFTEYPLSYGTDKLGAGYERVSLSPTFVERKIFLFDIDKSFILAEFAKTSTSEAEISEKASHDDPPQMMSPKNPSSENISGKPKEPSSPIGVTKNLDINKNPEKSNPTNSLSQSTTGQRGLLTQKVK